MNRSPISHLRSPRSTRPRPATGTTLTSIRFGDVISAAPSYGYKHPWFTTPAWLPEAQRWGATVNSGFVNGSAPIYRATVAEQKGAGNPWENNPLTGQQFFSAPIFAQQSTNVSAESVDIPLYLNPAIALDFRALGFDGDPNGGIPEYFLNLGVAPAPPQQDPTAELEGGTSSAPTPPPKNLRLLRACDLWVHQPRLGLTSTFSPGGLGGAPFVQQLSVASPAPSDTLRVIEGTFAPYSAATAGIDPTSADYTEPTYDEILISTVYLLSPPNTAPGSEPDSTWQPYVRHNLFWNLNWGQPSFREPAAEIPSITFPPLAGGAASLLIGITQSLLADAQQTALNTLLGTSLAGTFWTPTGGGSSAGLSTANPQLSTPPGPDRSKNAAAKLAAQQQAQRAAQLDPDFPYNAQPFPTSFLTAA